jgi:hypothetical protein
MRLGEKLAKPKTINWEAVSAWATAEIVTTFYESPEFMSAEMVCDQCWLPCRLLRENRISVVPYSLIEKILGTDKGTVKCHHKRNETVRPLTACNGWPPLVAEERRQELIQRIEEADQRGIPWMKGEILEFVQERSPELVDKNSLIGYNERSELSSAQESQWRTTDSQLHRKQLLTIFNALLRTSPVSPRTLFSKRMK